MKYIADPLSRSQLRLYAAQIRIHLHLENELFFPVVPIFESLHKILGDESFYNEIVDDDDLPQNIHAEYSFEDNCIRLKQSVYDGACTGNGRDRMTMCHEMGHVLLLKHSGVKFQRSFSDDIEPFRDPEWHAKCFAGELLIPAHLVGRMTALEVMQKCGVSYQAAEYQLRKIREKAKREA